MKIAVSGSTGFIGKHLVQQLVERGHQIVPVRRELLQENSFQYLVAAMRGCDAVINLAGASINHRWTDAYKKELYSSRIGVTRQLVRAMHELEKKPDVMISASAVGYYPSQGEYDEYAMERTEGFLAALCRDWEAEAGKCPQETRLVITRFAVVLSPDGGALPQMLLPLRWFRLSPVIGNGRQAFPWIGLTDLCRALVFLVEDGEACGIYNLTSPQMITQRYFAEVSGKAYHAWGLLPVPAWFFKLLYGEAASVMIAGQKVRPRRLLDAGFTYLNPTIEQFFLSAGQTLRD